MASEEVIRNGHTRHRKQNYKCRECGRQFVLNPAWKAITPEQQELMSRMLLEVFLRRGWLGCYKCQKIEYSAT